MVLAQDTPLLDHNAAVAILLLILGLGLLVAEVFIPSGGAITIVSLAALGGSLVFAWQAWWETSRGYFWGYIASVITLIPFTFILAFSILPRTSFGRRFLLEAPDLSELTPYSRDEPHFTSLIGKYGRTLTLLNPGGLVLLEGQRVHAESEGMLIEPDTDIQAIARKGNRIVVRIARPPVEPETNDQQELEPPAQRDAALDFDFPQG